MRHIETKICRKCGKPYLWQSGGIVMTPEDYADRGLCKVCRCKDAAGKVEHLIDIMKKK